MFLHNRTGRYPAIIIQNADVEEWSFSTGDDNNMNKIYYYYSNARITEWQLRRYIINVRVLSVMPMALWVHYVYNYYYFFFRK